MAQPSGPFAVSAFKPAALHPAPSSSFLLGSSAVPQFPLSQSYAVLCKVVLVRRLTRHAFTITTFVAFAALLGAVFDPKELPGSLFSLFNFLPVLLYTPLAFVGAVPVFVLRKQTLTTAPAKSPSRFAQLASLTSATSLPVLIAYLIGSAPVFTAYLWCASSVSTDARLGLLFYHKGRDLQMLNERRIFLTLLHLFLAFAATMEHVVKGRSRVEFDADSSLTIPTRLAAKAKARAPLAIRNVLVANAVFFATYVLLRRPVLRFLVVNLVGAWARPYLYSILRHNAAYSFTLCARSLASTLLTTVVWEAMHVCFEVYVTQPMTVSHFAPHPNKCLLSGLCSEDPYFQHFAYLELSVLTLTNEARRKAIFVDIKPDGTKGGAWHDISRECLKLVGTELQRAKGKGKIAVPSSTSSSASASPPRSSPSLPSAPVIAENIFKPTNKSFFDTLAPSPAPSSPSKPSAISSAVATTTSTLTSRVPSIFQTSAPASAAPEVVEPTLPKQGEVKGFEQSLSGFVPAAWRGSLFATIFGRRPSYVVGICTTRRREAIWAIHSLANLLCASLREDPYGVAQRDIPMVLEGFVLYLITLEDLDKDLVAAVDGPGKDAERTEMQREIAKQVGPVQEALKDGVRAVLDEFAPFLGEFKFPPRIATRLQLLVDWG